MRQRDKHKKFTYQLCVVDLGKNKKKDYKIIYDDIKMCTLITCKKMNILITVYFIQEKRNFNYL